MEDKNRNGADGDSRKEYKRDRHLHAIPIGLEIIKTQILRFVFRRF